MSIKIISRGQGKSAVAAAAYRSGESITNEYDGIVHDYTRKGGVVHTEILLPGHAPREYVSRAVLWNAVERAEKNSNAQLAWEIEIALPAELSREQNITLAREYAQRHFADKGMCTDVCIHDKNDGNPHTHIMLTMRPIEKDGSWGAKSKKEYIFDEHGRAVRLKNGVYKTYKSYTVDWNARTKAEEWRAGWAELCNQYLELENHAARVDHRSYERQGVEQIPTVHLGVAASQMERKGIATGRGNTNREIEITNSRLRQLRARIVKLQSWLKEAVPAVPPGITEVIHSIVYGSAEKRGRYKITELKAAEKALGFLTANGITNMADLDGWIRAMYSKQLELSDQWKPVERRMNTLDEHFRQMDIYHEHREIYRQYQQEQKPKKKAAFYEAHRAELSLYETARDYLGGVLQGHATPPTAAWREEYERLAAKQGKLSREYHALTDEIGEVEKVKWTVCNLVQSEKRREQQHRKPPTRARGMER